MGAESVSTVVGLHNIPEAIRSLTTIADPDYADLCTATTGDATNRSPEQWARAVLEETPLGHRARLLWQRLGLRLGAPGSPDHVQGWKIAERGDNWIRVETASSYMTAHAAFWVDDGRVSLALFLRYDRPIAARIWSPVSVMHRRAVPELLRQALTHHVDASHTRQM
jgi:hypothetical protein